MNPRNDVLSTLILDQSGRNGKTGQLRQTPVDFGNRRGVEMCFPAATK